MIEIKIAGLSELQHVLQEMPKDVARKVIRGALNEAADEMREHFVAAAPKDSGFLSQHFNVKIRMQQDELAATAFIGPQGKMYYPNVGDRNKGVATGRRPKKGGAVPVASVARFLEFGTSKMAARPFMRPVFEGRKEWVLKNVIDGIKSALAKWTK